MVDFIAGLPVTQPNLLFAAVQFLTGPDDMPRSAPELREFVERRGGELGAVMRSRRTQTNEVGRCAVLLPALPPGPLALLEVGASAGLCLLLDQFHYEFGSTALGAAVVARSLALRAHRPGAPPRGDARRGVAPRSRPPSARRARR